MENKQQMIELLKSLITRCEKMQPKFEEGTSQAALLKNRIKALEISLSLLMEEGGYDLAEMEKALPPILSIIHKNEKILIRYEEESLMYRKIFPIIQTMRYVQRLIENEIEKVKNIPSF